MADERTHRSSTSAVPPRTAAAVDPPTVISKRPPPVAEVPPSLGTSLQELGRSLEGQRLGHFQLEAFVGGGGMGAVFRATDTKLGRIVAVKILSKDRTDEDTIRRFQNEAQSAARLDHPNIARVYYVGEDLGWNYIVFEYIEGTNIRDLVLEHGPLSLDETIPFMLQLGEALDHASRRDVVHRDIKPSNILVMPDGHVKLVDMGLARLHQVEATNADLTATGVTLGTFDYISPEQANDPRSADVRSDLYSLGCTFFFMLTGQPPFPGGTMFQKLMSHSSKTPPDVRSFRPDLGEEVSVILGRLLAKQPAQRYQTPTELIGALLLLAESLGLKDVSQMTQVWVAAEAPAARLQRQLPWLVPVAIMLVGAVALQWFWPHSSPYDPARMRPVFAAQRDPSALHNDAPSSPVKAAADGDLGTSPNTSTGAAANNKSDQTDREPADKTAAETSSGNSSNEPKSASIGKPTTDGTSKPGGDAANVNSSSNPTTSNGPLRRIVVGSDEMEGATDGSVRPVATFHDALELARQEATVESIELRWNGERKEVDCALNLSGRRLAVRPAAGFHPTLVFRPLTGETVAERRMLRLTQSNLVWEGVGLLFVLPTDPYDNWALFALDRSSSLELTDCLVTVRNAGRDGQSVNRVACVEWTRATTPEMMATERPARPGPPPLVALRNAIVRGQTALVRTPDGVPFRLTWQQGLFASTEQLVVARGSSTQPAVTDGLQIDLQHVTVALGGALCQMQMDVEHRFPWMLVCRMVDCIVLKAMGAGVDTTRPLVLVEQHFAAPVEPLRKRPFLSGSGNYYPPDALLLKVDAVGFAEESIEYALADRDRARDEKWYDEQPTLGMVMWEKLPVDQPVHLQTKQDFVLDVTPQNPARVAGFDPAVLPDPDAPRDKPADPPREDRP